ncbi:MAG: chloride channel protein [Xanthomonadaceae bacterium]|nr:chloride channel protein [Xanthomonadaceae bacterium]
MMPNTRAMLIGVVAGLISALIRGFWFKSGLNWIAFPIVILALAVFLALFEQIAKRFKWQPKRAGLVTGTSEILAHVHLPPEKTFSEHSFWRGMESVLLSMFGGRVGVEGAATSFAYAFALKSRTNSAQWFEQQRRTDAASALAAGIACMFGSPFAAIILPLELNLGGRTLSVAFSAAAAVATTQLFVTLGFTEALTPTTLFLEFGVTLEQSLRLIFFTLSIGLLFGFLSVYFLVLTNSGREGWNHYRHKLWFLPASVGCLILFAILVAYPEGFGLPNALLEGLLNLKDSPTEMALTGLTQILSALVGVNFFGTVGVFTPIFVSGAGFAAALGTIFFGAYSLPALLGGSALLSGIFNTPLTAAFLAYELSGNWTVLLPCFIAAWVSREVVVRFRGRGLVDEELQFLGVELLSGRQRSILKSLKVSSAMVTDFDVVTHNESLTELHHRMEKSKYPFLPVIGQNNKYMGILTADIVEYAMSDKTSQSLNLDAKDLLFRSGSRPKSIQVDDHLDIASEWFEETPLIPVLAEGDKIVGLLFVHNVRIAYDREVANRFLLKRKQD